MEGPITIPMVLAFVTIIGAVGSVWWRIEAKLAERFAEVSTELKAVASDLRITQRDLADYKLHVAQNHVSIPTLKDTEERLITAIDKLATRLETIVARLDKIAVR